MKHPTASADLAGSGNVRNHDSDFMRGIERDLAEPMDGDALAGSHMASDMVRHVHLDPSTVSTLAGALAAQRLRNDPDARKPWVEPTVTECATTNRRPATLTISGVDLPNPAPPTPSIAPTAAEILNAVGWLRNRAALQPVRTAEFESIARIMEGLGDETLCQAAEISELQDMLKDAIGPVRLVSQFATMTDTECEFLDGMEVRDWARNKLDGDFVMPRLYGEEDRKRAIHAALALNGRGGIPATIDVVAEALGLQRAC